jgi:membrane-bound lytic murein transglycosylase B
MGAAKIKTYAQVIARIDQQYGVPAPVIVVFWALESDFGARSLMIAGAPTASAPSFSMPCG